MEFTQPRMKTYGKHPDDQLNHHCEKNKDNNLLGITTIDLKFRHKQHSASLDEISPKR